MDVKKEIKNNAIEFYKETKNDKNGRYKSWEYCYYIFYEARKKKKVDYDYLSLQLAFYLASWGMYRGSSFLLKKDYKIHKKAIEIILEDKYDTLFGIECSKLTKKSNAALLVELSDRLEKYYTVLRKKTKKESVKSKVSQTLITKILLGTLGCVPAYDENFVIGVKKTGIATGNYNSKSLNRLIEFYEDNDETFESVRANMMVKDISYPQMKILDMGFWELGKKIKEENND